ncbi:hypothetical protein P872_18125 [Rhodonellum psychrophilum GCM71 = DSM 17998]|uniref:Uncharacterized protein n=1 Tax=Rhodonellum psychrophilum GCM71 = DSM 17998 TaxID=1123057 RepID=U5BPE3_9BACT|nr:MULTISPECIES: hypothetical protein [Rhodonellum]ERM82430.1 hypothetical protein P872_18125 [Rhodonellum psychrophilum GCM71 = DSM 17998]MDO9553203.1 hypothetical protein [Rhodonellum sp.]
METKSIHLETGLILYYKDYGQWDSQTGIPLSIFLIEKIMGIMENVLGDLGWDKFFLSEHDPC